MTDAESVKFTLCAGRERRESLILLDRREPIATAREDLVRIRLMSDIPDQPVVRRLEHVMQRHRQFDSAQARRKVSALAADGLDQVSAQLFGDLRQVTPRQRAQVRRRLYSRKKRKFVGE